MNPTEQFLRAATDWARAELAICAGKNLPRCIEQSAGDIEIGDPGTAACWMRGGVPLSEQCAACQMRARTMGPNRTIKRNARRRMLRWVERLPEPKL